MADSEVRGQILYEAYVFSVYQPCEPILTGCGSIDIFGAYSSSLPGKQSNNLGTNTVNSVANSIAVDLGTWECAQLLLFNHQLNICCISTMVIIKRARQRT